MQDSDHDSGPESGRRGRRGGGSETRAALLTAARAAFIEHGYDGATVRGIAGRAGVDPAMVRHWFGDKKGLFTTAVALPVEPDRILAVLLDGPVERLAERMLRAFLSTWDSAGGGEFTALMRSLSTGEQAARLLREFLTTTLLEPLLRSLEVDRRELRAALCGSQLVGLGMMRYVVRLEPLDSTEHETIVTAVAPNLQHYLTGRLDPA
ncbi:MULTISPECIES: TetR family transcriptional regulator [unclassified Actinopolyspora]|uniref:TetR/AcrR family transcriptional regulator n=1 Tax=unclassified Actinopolyspora TaxID=2639451 RepID=UPI0013F670C1|nr:TetR/AcrR family transcriptional regulator [Actinopolyspora sp. BKK2]NHE76225.1 TetR/AcrR family transcriptional regulator [Actinopolyspora sp. BKK1]